MGPGNEGFVCGVVLSFAEIVNLPPEGTATIARFTTIAACPAAGETEKGRIRYQDGLRGAGQSVQNSVILGIDKYIPHVEDLSVSVSGPSLPATPARVG